MKANTRNRKRQWTEKYDIITYDKSDNRSKNLTQEQDIAERNSNDSRNSYLTHALEILSNQYVSYEDKRIFICNALEQITGQELELSCESFTSRCLEMLFQEVDDLSVIIRFMKAFSEDMEAACRNKFASHITESLLYYGLRSMKNWSSDVETVEQNKECTQKAEQIIYVISWIHSLGEFCLMHLQTCLEDVSGSHVLRTVIHALGGYYICKDNNQSKKSKERAKFFEEHLDPEQKLKEKETITLDAIPKFFVTILKKLAKAFMKCPDIKAFAVQPETASVIEVLLFVLSKRLPKRCQKFIDHLSSNLFSNISHEGIPEALVHKNCSYVVEKIFESAREDQHQDLWGRYIDPFLEQLVNHAVGNFVIQRMFSAVNSKTQFESMCNSLFNHFDSILASRHYDLWIAMASACNRIKAQQAQFMQHLMHCFCCSQEERRLLLVPLLLSFEKYNDFVKRKRSSDVPDITVIHQGSLLIQTILKFQKPLKVVKSLLNMKPEEISFLACHSQGCYILTCFMDSVNVGEKNKDKLLQSLKPQLSSLACDPSGNLTLSRMWVLMTLKQKSLVAEELWKHMYTLQKNHCGFSISKKFDLAKFKQKNDLWKEGQQNLAKKRKLTTS